MATSLETLAPAGRAEIGMPRLALGRLLRSDLELLSLIASLGWSVILLTTPALFERTFSFAAMADLGSQTAWSIGIGIGALVQLLGVTSGYGWLRLLGALVGSAQWTFIALMIASSGITTGIAVYFPMAVMIALRTVRQPD